MIAQARVRCFQSSEHSSGIPRSRSFTFHIREGLKAPRKNGLAQVPGQSEFPGKSRKGSEDRTPGMAAVATTKSLPLPSLVVNTL